MPFAGDTVEFLIFTQLQRCIILRYLSDCIWFAALLRIHLFNPFQHSKTLNMARLWKEVKAAQTLDLVSDPIFTIPKFDIPSSFTFHKFSNVPGLRVYIATYINHPFGPKTQ